jgi:long-chain acyl-CoA synthetase
LPADLEDFWNHLGFALIQGYGMTETAALVTLNHPFRIGHGTLGKALPGREIHISDDGEILVRGDMLAAATWHGGTLHPRSSEWLATGDLAAKDESGELRFLGRKGEVIVTGGGMNIHPADLEEAMAKLPGIRGCVVVPYETISGPEPVAVVLLSTGDFNLNLLVGQANRELAEYQYIRRALKWPNPQFPYTSTGKLLRREVAEWACAMLSNPRRDVPTPVAEGADFLINMIAEVTGEYVTGANDRFRLSEDLHLDSLGRVQLQSALEQKFGLEVEDEVIAGAETLADLRALLEQKEGTGLALQAGKIGPAPVTTADVSTSAPVPEKGLAKEQSASELPFPQWPWCWPSRGVRIAFIELVMRPLIWLIAAPRVVRETEQLPQEPVLIIANHVTAYDGALILYALPARLRQRIAIAMSAEVLWDLRKGRNQQNALRNLFAPPGYWLVTALFNVFPMPRRSGFRKSFAHAGEAMDRGYSVMIFPEGARSLEGKLQPFRPGIGLLAQQSHVPILPVALIGLGEMRTGKTRWFRSGRLEIHVGEAVAYEEDAEPTQLTARLEESVRRLQSKDRPAQCTRL